MKYIPYPAKMSQKGRQALLDAYPALSYHKHSRGYLSLAQYFIFSNYTDDSGNLIVPATHIAQLVEHKPVEGDNYFAAIKWLDAFSQDVWPLRVFEYDQDNKQARSIENALPEDVLAILANEPIGAVGSEFDSMVWFVTGVKVTRKKHYAEAAVYTENLKQLASGIGSDHPAFALQQYLNEQPQTVTGKILRNNWPRVHQAFELMEEGPAKRSAMVTLLLLRDYFKLIYAASEKTPRLHALYTTIHNLPRHLRKLALTGTTSMDLRSCQLAIVAKLWSVPRLEAFLASGESIWRELQSVVGPGGDDKDALKTALYSILFGGRQENIAVRLDQDLTGGEVARTAFFNHPIIKELIAARNKRLLEIRRERHVIDAFGRRINYDACNVRMRSLLAQEVQSYEVKIMTALLPILQSERDVAVISWLHDGLTVHFSDCRQKDRIIARMVCAVDAVTTNMGIMTQLVVER